MALAALLFIRLKPFSELIVVNRQLLGIHCRNKPEYRVIPPKAFPQQHSNSCGLKPNYSQTISVSDIFPELPGKIIFYSILLPGSSTVVNAKTGLPDISNMYIFLFKIIPHCFLNGLEGGVAGIVIQQFLCFFDASTGAVGNVVPGQFGIPRADCFFPFLPGQKGQMCFLPEPFSHRSGISP